ncbi:NAD(P)-binding protein [Halobacillus salinarum]|uniref:NAD(P)-binding protein n=1 Tax=Halobacillus salinarum TaxID=2932257 RepID=A0ABY4EKP5_9BACI|nr:NAD(P)-binding protein [Halobacillus salinarum]UOQ44204.1 NAD(P)-binding protein [Halobacillus salinarum]
MKVAIIGAGLAGLSCALTLEKHGISADIYEKQREAGFQVTIAELMTPVIHAPIKDAVKYFSENHELHLRPMTNIQKIHVHSKNESAFIEGNLGFINMRGTHEQSFEKQMASQLNHTTIHYNHHVTHEELAEEYSPIILASGDPCDTEHIQPFETAFTSTFSIAIVHGNFIKTEVHTWFNNQFAPKGMAYLLPHSESEATLALVYPQYGKQWMTNKESFWKETKAAVSKTLNQELSFEKEYSINDYAVGRCRYPRIGNTFFTGNCLGALTPFLGFGQTSSILSGIYAALDICRKGDYEKLSKQLLKDYHYSLTLRNALEHLNDHQFDLVTKSLHLPMVEKAITSPHANFLKVLSQILRPFIKSSEQKLDGND